MTGRRLRAAATSPWLILVAALVFRLGFAWNYEHHNPRQALSVLPFLFESGNIAYSLATGNGFSSPFRVPTGPTAWMTPVYPALLAGVYRVFGTYTFSTFLAASFLNILFSALVCLPLFFAGKRVCGIGVAAGAAWLWAVFPNAIQIPVESMWDACLAALLAATILWATLALDESRRLRNWCAYGLLWGFTLMTSAAMASLLPFLLVWLAYRAWLRSRADAPPPARGGAG
ncbi:MAG: glycosyltransferase family 39 protein, partial [Candidatus Acidiferrales bacterium]